MPKAALLLLSPLHFSSRRLLLSRDESVRGRALRSLSNDVRVGERIEVANYLNSLSALHNCEMNAKKNAAKKDNDKKGEETVLTPA